MPEGRQPNTFPVQQVLLVAACRARCAQKFTQLAAAVAAKRAAAAAKDVSSPCPTEYAIHQAAHRGQRSQWEVLANNKLAQLHGHAR
jgi:hypothetical protein